MQPSPEQIWRYTFMWLKLDDTASSIHEQFTQVYGEGAPSYSSITDWMRQLEEGRSSFEGEPRSGRAAESVNEETLQLDRRLIIGRLSLKCSLPISTVQRTWTSSPKEVAQLMITCAQKSKSTSVNLPPEPWSTSEMMWRWYYHWWWNMDLLPPANIQKWKYDLVNRWWAKAPSMQTIFSAQKTNLYDFHQLSRSWMHWYSSRTQIKDRQILLRELLAEKVTSIEQQRP